MHYRMTYTVIEDCIYITHVKVHRQDHETVLQLTILKRLCLKCVQSTVSISKHILMENMLENDIMIDLIIL